VRYMDDFTLFADDKATLRAWHTRLEAFLQGELRLSLKTRATILAPVSQGLPFLGWRLYRGTRRLRPENRKRTHVRLRSRRAALRAGHIDGAQYLAAVRSVLAHVGHGDTLALRRTLVAGALAREDELGSGPQAPRTASTAAAASTTPPRTRAPRTATTTRRRTATTTTASVPRRPSQGATRPIAAAPPLR